jgi:hypothetical protein
MTNPPKVEKGRDEEGDGERFQLEKDHRPVNIRQLLWRIFRRGRDVEEGGGEGVHASRPIFGKR